MNRIQRERELTEQAKTDPRKKLVLLMLKAKRFKEKEKEEKAKQEAL